MPVPKVPYFAKLNGGYWSVVNSMAYPATRKYQRNTPAINSNKFFGMRPVNRIANQEIMMTIRTIMLSTARTM